jgi:fructokinase
MLPRTHVLKVSDEDLALLYPGRSPDDFASAALAAGTSWVVVTRGGQGATGFTAAGRAEVPSVKVDVQDTVGAGDTFQASLLTWLSETGRLSMPAIAQLDAIAMRQALGFAARAAAITCSRRGADLPRRKELS